MDTLTWNEWLADPRVVIRDDQAEIAGRWVPLLPPLPDGPLGYFIQSNGIIYDLVRSVALRWPGITVELPAEGVRLLPYNVAQIAAR